MSKKKGLTVIFSSHKGKEYDAAFSEKIKSTSGVDTKVICIENNNQYSLTEAYNEGWMEYDDLYRNDIVVFCHNDIHFKTPKWGDILIKKFAMNPSFGIIGLAGSTTLADNGVWWHNRATCYGIVNHTDGVKEWETMFAPPIKNIKEVAVIDGVFIAVNPDIVEMEFNEEFKGFHLYDIAFSADNFLEGTKIGVITDIRIMHESVGMVNEQWEQNRKQFAETYKEHLPLKVK